MPYRPSTWQSYVSLTSLRTDLARWVGSYTTRCAFKATSAVQESSTSYLRLFAVFKEAIHEQVVFLREKDLTKYRIDK